MLGSRSTYQIWTWDWIELNKICRPYWTLRVMTGPKYWRPRAVRSSDLTGRMKKKKKGISIDRRKVITKERRTWDCNFTIPDQRVTYHIVYGNNFLALTLTLTPKRAEFWIYTSAIKTRIVAGFLRGRMQRLDIPRCRLGLPAVCVPCQYSIDFTSPSLAIVSITL